MLKFSEPEVIKTDVQYRECLSEVEQLMALDPDADSAEGKRLELLALLAETFEKERYRIPLPNPVDAILFRLEQKGLQQKDLIPLIGSKGRVSEVLSGKRRLTVPMVRKLSMQLDIPASVLVAEPQPAQGGISDTPPPISVVREIVRRGWVAGGKVTARNAMEFVERLFQRVGSANLGPTYLRSSIHTGMAGYVNLYSIRLWIAEILIKSRSIGAKRGAFKRDAFTQDALPELARLSWFENGPKLAVEYLSKHGIVVVTEKHLPGTHLDGAAVLDLDGTPVIGLTVRHDRLDNFWFTLLHECVHVIKHLKAPGEAFVDDTERVFDANEEEIEANRIARDSLIPPEEWRRSDANRLRSAEAIVSLAKALRIHPAIVAGRIRREAGNYKLFSSLVGHRLVKKVLEI